MFQACVNNVFLQIQNYIIKETCICYNNSVVYFCSVNERLSFYCGNIVLKYAITKQPVKYSGSFIP
jgi:hypothetical protein